MKFAQLSQLTMIFNLRISFILIFLIVNSYHYSTASDMLNDSLSDSDDFNTLHNRAGNLIYLSYGNQNYHELVISKIIHEIFQSIPEIVCFDMNMSSHSEIEKAYDNFKALHSNKLLIFSNVESLNQANLQKLNILLRASDRTFKLTHLVILLCLNFINDIEIPISNLDMKTVLVNRLSSVEYNVNGAAIVGRITRLFTINSIENDFNSDSVCLHVEKYSVNSFVESLTIESIGASIKCAMESFIVSLNSLVMKAISFVMKSFSKYEICNNIF